ncbi:Cytoplasmic axial filament protein CafA and Ribonuclease G [Labilithrix luteola]|uniref:Cytoplasmic axial filament protein CafA and Ribonuclease G n=1 Tax=Labilithrix luteola TaxID=1391654 RepID=A0A0K1PSX0_9BACT|nr:Rne/Rng family ribonuclease [Labilithrix luteola]AKU96617.1 Cytoplasmic axial filament protein CafA and Ribonuclease G [Labilithrix luteola]
MAKNILVISCDIRETRAALIENGIIAELHIERKGRQSSTVGNVYLGKVTRVLPGLQAAFIDIGQERAAFLHVEDLIRPDDFDEYLAGGRKLARGEEGGGSVELDESEGGEGADSGEVAAEAGGAEGSAAEEGGVSSAPEPVPSAPILRESTDLEATVSYDNWPAPAKHRAGTNGTSTVKRALVEEVVEEVIEVSEAPASEAALSSAALPPSSSSSISITADIASSPLITPAPASADELLARGSSDDDSSHSFNSAPTLDELPEDEDAFADSEHDDEDEDEDEHEEAAVPADVTSEVRLDHIQPDSPMADASVPLIELDEDESESESDSESESEGEDDDDILEGDDLPGFTVSEPGEPVPRAPAPARTSDRGERGGRRRRGRRRGASGEGRERRGGAEARGGSRGERGGSRGERSGSRGGDHRDKSPRGGERRGGRPAQNMPGRISKSTPIREVVREGQEIIVQVTKDPIGTKGARCSSHISLPGRYVVYLPTVDHIGISKRIGNDKERARLREAIEAMKPPSGGLIVRTVAEGLTKKGLKQDVGYLVRLWGEIAKKRDGAKAPNCLSSELDLVLKVARDLFTDEVDEVVIDDKQQYERLCRFVEMFAPERVKNVKLYDEEEPIFDEYGIEDEIGRALSRKVPLPSGGYLIIDQAEALTAIDVNTGRFVGKGSKDMEETILKTNLEAVNEIAYQLRFRNIGGLIILDLIDMEQHKNREKVRRTLEELLQRDKAKTTLNRISELGLIEMTRKRTRESLGRLMHEPCFYCDGTGQLQSKETIAYEILREVRRKRATLPGYSVVVNAHPAVADVLNGAEREAVADAENRFMRKIIVVPRKEYHLEQFDLQGK